MRLLFALSVLLISPVFIVGTIAKNDTHHAGTFRSGALGLTMSELEARYGPSSLSPASGRDFGDHRMNVIGGTGQRIEYTIPPGKQFSLSQARQLGVRLSPSDAHLIKREATSTGLPVEVYRSETLARRFHAVPSRLFGSLDPWYGARPGTFIVIYRLSGDQVSSVVLATGNNP